MNSNEKKSLKNFAKQTGCLGGLTVLSTLASLSSSNLIDVSLCMLCINSATFLAGTAVIGAININDYKYKDQDIESKIKIKDKK